MDPEIAKTFLRTHPDQRNVVYDLREFSTQNRTKIEKIYG